MRDAWSIHRKPWRVWGANTFKLFLYLMCHYSALSCFCGITSPGCVSTVCGISSPGVCPLYYPSLCAVWLWYYPSPSVLSLQSTIRCKTRLKARRPQRKWSPRSSVSSSSIKHSHIDTPPTASGQHLCIPFSKTAQHPMLIHLLDSNCVSVGDY